MEHDRNDKCLFSLHTYRMWCYLIKLISYRVVYVNHTILQFYDFDKLKFLFSNNSNFEFKSTENLLLLQTVTEYDGCKV